MTIHKYRMSAKPKRKTGTRLSKGTVRQHLYVICQRLRPITAHCIETLPGMAFRSQQRQID